MTHKPGHRKIVDKRTPKEIAQAKQEGQATIRSREKEINKRKAAGQSQAGARRDTLKAETERLEFKSPEQLQQEKLQQTQTEVTILQKEREAEKKAQVTVVGEEPPAEVPPIAPESQPEQQLAPDGTPLLSGTVTPVTASNLIDVVTLFTGFGLAKGVAKGVGKAALKGGIIGENIVKTTMLTSIKNKLFGVLRKSTKRLSGIATGLVIGTSIGVAGKLIEPFAGQKITAADRQIRSLDTELSQVRETITAPVQLVATGVPSTEGLDMVDDMRVDVLETRKKIKELELKSQEMKTNPEFTAPSKKRIEKLLLFLDLSERQILEMQVTGRVPTSEELAYLLSLYEPILKED